MIDGAEAGTVWGAAFLKPHGAEAAKSDIVEAGLSFFNPQIKTLEVSRRLRRRELLREPIVKQLFHGYVFVGWPAGSGRWAEAVQARGVADLVRSCGKLSPPALVPEAVMKGLLAAGELLDLTVGQAVCEQEGQEGYVVGDVVQVDRPGFEDQLFTIARLDPKRRIRFILQSLKPGFEKFELKASAKDLKRVAA